MKKRVTMLDVAKAANVTPQTVSRAFRNAPDISEETRERILRIATNLNYVKNNTASTLRNGNSKHIAIVYDILTNIYFSVMINYLQGCLMEKGYSVMVIAIPNIKLDAATYKFAVSHDAAGLISFLEPDDDVSALVEAYEIPVLLLGRRTEMANVDYLRTDDEGGGRCAARRLLALGCKRPAFLSIDLRVSCAYDRYKGFAEEIAKWDLPEPLVLNGYDQGWEDSFARQFSDCETAPDGLFCFNDMLAFNALYIFEKYRLPRIKIVGFDCIQKEIHIPNRLTSVGVDKQSMAARAAEIIVYRIENGFGLQIGETMPVEIADGESA